MATLTQRRRPSGSLRNVLVAATAVLATAFASAGVAQATTGAGHETCGKGGSSCNVSLTVNSHRSAYWQSARRIPAHAAVTPYVYIHGRQLKLASLVRGNCGVDTYGGGVIVRFQIVGCDDGHDFRVKAEVSSVNAQPVRLKLHYTIERSAGDTRVGEIG